MMYRKSGRQRLALAALLAATATIVTLDFRQNPGGPLQRIQDLAVSVVAPLQSGLSTVTRPIGDFFSSIGQLGSLKSENARLEKEIGDLKAEQRELPEILRENRRLKELTKQQPWKQGAAVEAQIIGLSPSAREFSVFLDKGSAAGLAEEMAVVSAEGLVGRVSSVTDSYSKVILILDPQHSVGARLTNSSETGVITGRSEEDLSFALIDPDTVVADGETVVTSGYDRGVYPPGIPIGRVTSANLSSDGLSKFARVRPFVDFSRLDTVQILTESGPIMQPGT